MLKTASCAFGEARYTGLRGNDIKISVYTDPDDSSYKNVYDICRNNCCRYSEGKDYGRIKR